jgi:hypothetical protein
LFVLFNHNIGPDFLPSGQQKESAPFRANPPQQKKLGVRLRARQVLCNNCKNVCTENGETVQQVSLCGRISIPGNRFKLKSDSYK